MKISRKILTVLVLGLVFLGASVSAHADTRYVSDTLVITMRSGAGNQFRILKTLKTDTPVEVLEEESEYLKVRTKDGTEGWVLGQYISPDTPKPVIISRLRGQIAGLKADIEKLEAERATLTREMVSVVRTGWRHK